MNSYNPCYGARFVFDVCDTPVVVILIELYDNCMWGLGCYREYTEKYSGSALSSSQKPTPLSNFFPLKVDIPICFDKYYTSSYK